MKLKYLLLLTLFLTNFQMLAQQSDSVTVAVAPKIYINCPWCDLNFIREEINFLNYVHDRNNADIHIMITRQETGSGGKEYTLTYFGQNSFQTQNDTTSFTINQDDTDDIIRTKMVKYLKIGLIPFLKKTDILDNITVSYDKPTSSMIKNDHWNNWVFRIRLSTWFNGEKSSRSYDLYNRLSADRITEDWKIRLSLGASIYENSYKWDNEWISSTQREKYFSGSFVKSLSDHWSAGGFISASSSSYLNIRSSIGVTPAIEYNIFPYSQSTHRELRILYRVGGEYLFYDSETIYFKTEENLFLETVQIGMEFNQPWGTVETTITGSHYFHDTSKNKLSIWCNLSLRVFKGFSINFYGSFSRIHNQLHLRREDLSKEDVLLQRYSLQTSYEYYGSIGFEYAFGSIYNNIVNPRFGG